MNRQSFITAVTVVGILTVSFVAASPLIQGNDNRSAVETPQTTHSNAIDPNEYQFGPIDDMHHFMEYVCEPSYKGLKQILETEPANRQAWKAFKNHAIVLAESSALVANRGPDDEAQSKQWKEISQAVHETGKSLYESAGDYAEAKKHYGLMIDQCNKCHDTFANGKHQLKK